MRINRDLVLDGDLVTLVPYRPEHVPTYHGWMADPWLQEMTASEPLSVEEEYAMCTSWQEDDDKLTFIVLDSGVQHRAGDALTAMVGDVNLFFHAYLQDSDDAGEGEGQSEGAAAVAAANAYAVAEVEVMIGEPSARRKGLATQAMRTMIDYSATDLGTRKFVAKIKMNNPASEAMFATKLGFVEVDRDEGFQEVELHLILDDAAVAAVAVRLASARRPRSRTPEDRKLTGYELWEQMGAPKYVVAPMVDQSELAFRMMTRKYGATLAYTPMIHARLFSEDKHYEKEFFTTCEGDRPLFVQFCGNDPQTLLAAAKRVEAHCDAVDLNLGCPQQIARRGNYGAFLAEDLPLVLDIVRTLADGLTIPVACKIRVQDDIEYTLAYAKALVEAGCKILCVHGRTRECKRHGLADWDKIRQVKESVDIPVIANGNIRSLEDCHACLKATKCDAVMSAETLLENPALFQPLPPSIARPLASTGGAPAADGDTAAGAEVPRMMMPPWDLATEYCDFARRHMKFAKNAPHLGMVRAHLFKILHQELARWPDLREEFSKQGLGTADPTPLYSAVNAVKKRALQHIIEEASVQLVPFKTRAEIVESLYGRDGRHPDGAINPTGVDDDVLEDADMGGFFGDEKEEQWDCCETEEEVAGKLAAMKLSAACDAPKGFFSADLAGNLPDYAVLTLPYGDSYGEGLLASGVRKCFMVRCPTNA